jgi:hypothetical protein
MTLIKVFRNTGCYSGGGKVRDGNNVPTVVAALVGSGGLRVGLRHGVAKGKVRGSPIGDGRRTRVSSPKRRQRRLMRTLILRL